MSQHVRVERVSDVLQQAAQAQLLLASLASLALLHPQDLLLVCYRPLARLFFCAFEAGSGPDAH